MKLLFDQNLSFKVKKKLADLYPDSTHVSDHNLSLASDIAIWEFARQNDFTIVTYDSDFVDLSVLKQNPPKIILLKIGNSTTDLVASRLRKEYETIKEFSFNPDTLFLEII
jgi:predicted nuclease of predicted toxin-antitoxin system